MSDKGVSIPFETCTDDEDVANLLEDFAIGKWAVSIAGMGDALKESYTCEELFRQMTVDHMIFVAHCLRDTAENLPVWNIGENSGEAGGWPGVSRLRAMKKNALAPYLAGVFRRVFPLQTMRQPASGIMSLHKLSEDAAARLVAVVHREEGAEDGPVASADIMKQYGEMILSGLLCPKRLYRSQDFWFYGLFMPVEVRKMVREQIDVLLFISLQTDLIDCYAAASVNLYGAVTAEDLKQIIQRYEAEAAGEGARYGNAAEIDRLIAESGEEGFADIRQHYVQIRRRISQELRKLSLEDFKSRLIPASWWQSVYKVLPAGSGSETTLLVASCQLIGASEANLHGIESLMAEQAGKQRYHPRTYAAFMGYTLDMVNDDVPALERLGKLADWLARGHREEIARAIRRNIEEPGLEVFDREYADTGDQSVASAAEEIARALYRGMAVRVGRNYRDAMGIGLLGKRYGILLRSETEPEEYLSLWNDISEKCRMFSNKGHTPLEMLAAIPPVKEPLKIRFGPGMQGTDLPRTVQKVLLSGGFGGKFSVDEEEVRRASKKVGRNDPCPCGSGKKYKNCCGRQAPEAL